MGIVGEGNGRGTLAAVEFLRVLFFDWQCVTNQTKWRNEVSVTKRWGGGPPDGYGYCVVVSGEGQAGKSVWRGFPSHEKACVARGFCLLETLPHKTKNNQKAKNKI